MLEYYRDLAEQLSAMPGGHDKLRTGYFGTVTRPGPIPDNRLSSGKIIEGWTLHSDGTLALTGTESGNLSLVWLWNDSEEYIAAFTGELLVAAREFSVPPLGLALLALAMGGVDDGQLKKLLPEFHKASKGLLLIAVCRLCG